MQGDCCGITLTVSRLWLATFHAFQGPNITRLHGFVMPIIHGKHYNRSVRFISGPLDGQETVADASDWKVVEDNRRIWFYLWDAAADAYRLDGSITGTRQTAVKLSQVLWQQPTPLHK